MPLQALMATITVVLNPGEVPIAPVPTAEEAADAYLGEVLAREGILDWAYTPPAGPSWQKVALPEVGNYMPGDFLFNLHVRNSGAEAGVLKLGQFELEHLVPLIQERADEGVQMVGIVEEVMGEDNHVRSDVEKVRDMWIALAQKLAEMQAKLVLPVIECDPTDARERAQEGS